MIELLRREFTVELPREAAWRHLARLEQWPSWARHIRQVEVSPPGELGPESTGRLHLNNGLKPGWPGSSAVFRVTEFNPHDNWKWVSDFLWLTCHYDHIFAELSPTRTKITFLIEGEGFGKSVLGRLFARVYRRSLDPAVARLVEEMNASGISR